MRRIMVAEDLWLDDEMFELTRAALQKLAPDAVAGFTWEGFIQRTNWLRIPDVEKPSNGWFKAQYTIKSGPPYNDFYQMMRLNLWRSADLRWTGGPMPHSHPWKRFVGYLLKGAYEEDRYEVQHAARLAHNPHSRLDLGSVSVTKGVLHGAGHPNDMPQTVFHEVRKVLEPGRTLSLMDCGPARKEGWGYLDPDTGLYVPNKESPIDPKFKSMMHTLNPHLRRR